MILPQATHEAHSAYAESGMLGAAQDYDDRRHAAAVHRRDGGQSFFAKAAVGIGAYAMLTSGNANLLMAHGTPVQQRGVRRRRVRRPLVRHHVPVRAAGRLVPVATSPRAPCPTATDFENDPLGPRYRLTGNKMWISAGEHELTENIVHLVLAKIPGPDGKLVPGTRGISLFIVPKKLVGTEGGLTGERNDVALAGLNHKLGCRGTTNTLLNFGEGKFPVRWRGRAPSATWWASRARACAACST